MESQPAPRRRVAGEYAVGKNADVPDFCPSCSKDTATMIVMNESAQMVATCGKCHLPKVATALSRPMAATGVLLGVEATRPVPVRERRPEASNVVPLRPAAPELAAARPVVGVTAEDIVAGARAELARLDAAIPSLQGQLAAAKAARRGLAKMVEAYDRAHAKAMAEQALAGSLFRAAAALDDPGPPPEPRMKRSQARAAAARGEA